MLARYGEAVTTPGRDARATIYDVARAVGVSPSTVSRAFSRPGRVSSETSRRIHAAAAELGYRRDPPERVRQPARSRVICLAVSDITNPFYFGIIRGAERAAAANDFTLMVADARESAIEERTMLARHLPLVDGLVLTSSRLSDTELRTLARQLPVVILNRQVGGLPCVLPDNACGTRYAVEHLATLGHTQIGYVAGPEASWADGARWRAVRETCLELTLGDVHVGPVAPTLAGGRQAAAEIIARGLTAVLAYNDLIAVGLVRGLVDAGVDVPGQVSVVGFDGTMAAELVTPCLTTVAAPALLMGEAATRQVVSLVNDTAGSWEITSVLPVHLTVRQSTGAVPSSAGRRR